MVAGKGCPPPAQSAVDSEEGEGREGSRRQLTRGTSGKGTDGTHSSSADTLFPHSKNSTSSRAQLGEEAAQAAGSLGEPSHGLCALVAVSILPPGGSREAASAPGVWWGQQPNSPTPSSLNSSNPVSPWPKYLGTDPSHRRCRGSSTGVQPNKPQNSA